jgi:hypothetical protein
LSFLSAASGLPDRSSRSGIFVFGDLSLVHYSLRFSLVVWTIQASFFLKNLAVALRFFFYFIAGEDFLHCDGNFRMSIMFNPVSVRPSWGGICLIFNMYYTYTLLTNAD